MPYWELIYHVVWATKNREPLLVGDVQTRVLDLIREKAANLGLVVHALNAMPDHVHLVAAIPPRLAVASAIGQVKGVSATLYNRERSDQAPSVYWQEEYAAFTLDRKRLPAHVAYVNAQQTHHANNTAIPALERAGG